MKGTPLARPAVDISRTFTDIPAIFVCVMIAYFFMANGPSMFEGWSTNYTALVSVYMSMMVGFVVWAIFTRSKIQEEIKKPIRKSIPAFVQSLLITYLIMAFLIYIGILSVPEFSSLTYWPQVILQFCVIATAEEVMFRGIILDALSRKNEKFGIVFSSLLFAIWHSTAYSILWYKASLGTINFSSLFISFIFGITMAFVVRGIVISKYKLKPQGLSAAVASHAVYNLAVLGLLFGGI
jgi:membrane protease YdiL (CAAX protease family)